jgi:hypothetical protein
MEFKKNIVWRKKLIAEVSAGGVIKSYADSSPVEYRPAFRRALTCLAIYSEVKLYSLEKSSSRSHSFSVYQELSGNLGNP